MIADQILDFVGKRVVTDVPETVYEPFDFHLRLNDDLAERMREARQACEGSSVSRSIEVTSDMAFSNSHPDWTSTLKTRVMLVRYATHLEFDDQSRQVNSVPVLLDSGTNTNLSMNGAISRGNAGAPFLAFLLQYDLLPGAGAQMIQLIRLASADYRDLGVCIIRQGKDMLDRFLNDFNPTDQRGKHAQQWFASLKREIDLGEDIRPAVSQASAPRRRL